MKIPPSQIIASLPLKYQCQKKWHSETGRLKLQPLQDRKMEDQIRSKANVITGKWRTKIMTSKMQEWKIRDRIIQDQIESDLPRCSGCKSSCCSCSCERHVTLFYYNSPKSHKTTKISIIVNNFISNFIYYFNIVSQNKRNTMCIAVRHKWQPLSMDATVSAQECAKTAVFSYKSATFFERNNKTFVFYVYHGFCIFQSCIFQSRIFNPPPSNTINDDVA